MCHKLKLQNIAETATRTQHQENQFHLRQTKAVAGIGVNWRPSHLLDKYYIRRSHRTMTTTTSRKDLKVIETPEPRIAFKGLKAIRNVKPGKQVVPIRKFPRTSTKYSTHKVKLPYPDTTR